MNFEKDKILSLLSGLLICNEAYNRSGMKPSEICFEYNEHGKPSVKSLPRFYFSVSHSGSCAAFVGDDFPIGLDLEGLSGARTEIAKRFFSPNEYRYIVESEKPDVSFYEIWTKKEAYLKLSGRGLSASLKSFDVTAREFSGSFYTRELSDYMLSVFSEKRRLSEDALKFKTYGWREFSESLPLEAWS